MAKKIILYYNILSPPSRAVLLCGAELGIEFELNQIDLLKLEHKKPEFIKVGFGFCPKIYNTFYLNCQL